MKIGFTKEALKNYLIYAIVLPFIFILSLQNHKGFAEIEDHFELTIMHTNDTHGHLYEIARRVTAVNQIRSEETNTILVDAGDVFAGTLFYNVYKGQADMNFLNMMGYDAMVPGNHEFDDGPGYFGEFVINGDFPFVSANIDYKKEPSLAGLFRDDIASSKEKGTIFPATILHINGEEVGIFGLTTEDTPISSKPGEQLVFEKHLEKAAEIVDRLEVEGINKIIALTHIGYKNDQALVESIKGIDVVVGGHSHTTLNEPTVINENGEPSLIVQAGEYGANLGKLNVTFDGNGVLQMWNGQLVNINSYKKDQVAEARLTELSAPLEDIKKELVGITDVFLDGERDNVRTRETNLGNLIADGLLAKAKEIHADTIIAFQNGGGIRASIPPGPIYLESILNVQPFGNKVVVLDLTGQEILDALENSVSKLDKKSGRFLQVSGIQYSFDPTQPEGERIIDVFIKSKNDPKPLKLDKTYKVATISFLAEGGEEFVSLKQAKNDGRMEELFLVDHDVFKWYLKKIGNVNISVENRITEVEMPVTTSITK